MIEENDPHATGLENRYHVQRTDGRDTPGQKHHGCKLFILDVRHDVFARLAMQKYMEACKDEYPVLATHLEFLLKDTESDFEEDRLRKASADYRKLKREKKAK
jgi:hypothetical protein